VGYLTGMVIGVCALLGLFWIPFKYPKAFFATIAFMLVLSAIAWLLGESNALSDEGSIMWVPVFAGAWWIYRRYMDPNRKRK
jgi:hypothetical protein